MLGSNVLGDFRRGRPDDKAFCGLFCDLFVTTDDSRLRNHLTSNLV